MDRLVDELEITAVRYGGRDYCNQFTDGVEAVRGVRNRGEDAGTRITFKANRMREEPHREYDYTLYEIEVEVTREIEKLPDIALEAAHDLYTDEQLAHKETFLEEKDTLFFTFDDDTNEFDMELEIAYSVDGDEVLSISSKDGECDRSNDSEDEDDGQAQAGDLDHITLSGSRIEELAEIPAEVELLNEAWAIIEAKQYIFGEEAPLFDVNVLRKMVRIDKTLQQVSNKEWRLLSLARQELQAIQAEQCIRILRKLRPGVTI